jgi:plastocyanin
MVDNPKGFIIIVISFLLSLTVINFATRAYIKESDSQTNFVLDVTTPNKTKTPTSGTKTSTTGTKVTPTTSNPSNPTVSPTTAKTDYTIRLTNSGFTPQTLNIYAGKSVRFINESSGSMYIASSRSPNSNDLTEFNQGRSVGKGGYYDFTFGRAGLYVYYNQNDRTKTGVIDVR